MPCELLQPKSTIEINKARITRALVQAVYEDVSRVIAETRAAIDQIWTALSILQDCADPTTADVLSGLLLSGPETASR